MCLFLWITLSHQRDKFSARSARDVNVVRNPFTRQKRSLKEERSGNNSVEERKRQRWKERVRKFRANIILQFTLCFLCRAWGFFFFYMSAVIRSDAARQQMPSEERPSGRTHRLHLHSTLQQHEAKRWGCCCSATQCQCRAYYGWRHEKEKKTDCITVLGGRLWRVTHHRKPASLHEQRRSPAVSFGNICCRSQL